MSKFTEQYLDRVDAHSHLLQVTVKELTAEIRRLKGLMVFIEPDGTRTECSEEEWIAKRKAAAATLGKLHQTKDGVRVVPGVDAVYRCMHENRGKYYWMHELATTYAHLTECSYFSLEAAEASGDLEAAEEKHTGRY
jgi:hypothetical protein